MALEVNTDRAFCYRCGKGFAKKKGNFPVSYAELHKGVGYLPICRSCLDKIYDTYLLECNDARLAVRQTCRKLDLFWDDKIFNSVSQRATSRSVMSQYLLKLANNSYTGKSYDDSLRSEGTMWNFTDNTIRLFPEENLEGEESEPISDDVIMFWGTGYTPAMYRELEQRRQYWMSKFPEGMQLDIGTEAIIRQICSLELDINRDRAAGRAVDKSVNALNTLLGSANLKPAQKKDDADSSLEKTPMGVWLWRYENKRPLPDTFDDSPILKYIFVWMGHLCKMVGIKDNKYTRLYEEELAKYTVEKPEYNGDDEDMFIESIEDIPIVGLGQ